MMRQMSLIEGIVELGDHKNQSHRNWEWFGDTETISLFQFYGLIRGMK